MNITLGAEWLVASLNEHHADSTSHEQENPRSGLANHVGQARIWYFFSERREELLEKGASKLLREGVLQGRARPYPCKCFAHPLHYEDLRHPD